MFKGFTGCGTAMVTPFRKDLSLDEETLRRLVRRQIAGGINFLVPCGTTGESPTLTHEEHLRVVAITIEEAKGKVPVLAGAGGYDTHKVIEMAREIERMGADGILSVTPYYNKPTQEGLYHHYKAIAAVDFAADHSLQRAAAHECEHRSRHRAPAFRNRKHHRREGSVREHRANHAGDPAGAGRFHRAFRRRCADAADRGHGRARNYFRGVERNSRGNDAAGAVVPGGRFRGSARHAAQMACRCWK